MKILALLLGIVICLSVTGCGGGQTPSPGNGETESAGPERSNEPATQTSNESPEPARRTDRGESPRQAEEPSPQITRTVSESPSENRGDKSPTGDARPHSEEASILDLMDLIPLFEVSWEGVYINDYGRAREAHGIQAPATDASDEELMEYLLELESTGLAPGPWISGYASEAALAQLEQAKHLGFGIGDVDRSVFVEKLPITLEAVVGRIDPEVTEGSLRRCGQCPDTDIREHGGVRFYSWGEDVRPDLDKSLHPPAFDRLGRGGRIAVLDSLAFRTIETEGMTYLIDTYFDNQASLADDPDLALAAGVLERQDVYSAMLRADVGHLEAPGICEVLDNCDEEEWEKMRSQLGLGPDQEGILDRYDLLGTGVGNDENGFYAVLVFIYENEDVARENVPVLEETLAKGVSVKSGQPWTELFPEGEVWADDRALIARLRTELPLIWMVMVHAGDSLLLHK